MAQSGHGEQALANLAKIERLAHEWSEREPLTLSAFVKKFKKHRRDEREEGENPLADAGYDAVKVMTIHKAKGLEFPVVILPNLSAERRAAASKGNLQRIWGLNAVGLRLGTSGATNAAMVHLENLIREREEAEEMRVFYVAATRAKEKMIMVVHLASTLVILSFV
jgi:ATP-dependent helicase/nuclease subunit A